MELRWSFTLRLKSTNQTRRGTTLKVKDDKDEKEAGRAAMELAAHPRAPRMPSCTDYARAEPNLLRRHVFDKLKAGAPGGPRWRLANDLEELEACAQAGNTAAAFRAALTFHKAS